MYNIGTKIKELRKRADMTQEQLADILGVAYQTVSKWECGSTAPDISMIAPIARFFKISADELFGLSESENDKRERELRERWGNSWDTGDVAERYAAAKEAHAEFPDNYEYLSWLADAEIYYADHHLEEHSEEWTSLYESAVKRYETLLENCPDDIDRRDDALQGLALSLPMLGRNDEAVKYAKMQPNPTVQRELLKFCLKGEAAEKNIQEIVLDDLERIVLDLEYRRKNLVCLKAAETIIKTIIDDGNYVCYHSFLWRNYVDQACCYTVSGQFEEAIEYLKKAYYHAVARDEIDAMKKGSKVPFTCAILNKTVFDPENTGRSGTTTNTQDFKEHLSRELFDPLRDRDDFKQLFAKKVSGSVNYMD